MAISGDGRGLACWVRMLVCRTGRGDGRCGIWAPRSSATGTPVRYSSWDGGVACAMGRCRGGGGEGRRGLEGGAYIEDEGDQQ